MQEMYRRGGVGVIISTYLMANYTLGLTHRGGCGYICLDDADGVISFPHFIFFLASESDEFYLRF